MSGDGATCYWIERDTGRVECRTLHQHDLRRGVGYAYEIETKHAREVVGTVLEIPFSSRGAAWAVDALERLQAEADTFRASRAG